MSFKMFKFNTTNVIIIGILFIFFIFSLLFIYFYNFPLPILNERGIALFYNNSTILSGIYKNVRISYVSDSPFNVKYKVHLPYGVVYYDSQDVLDSNIHVSIYPISLFKHFSLVLPLDRTLKLLMLLDLVVVRQNNVSFVKNNDAVLELKVYDDKIFRLWAGSVDIEKNCNFLLGWHCKNYIKVHRVIENIDDSVVYDYNSSLENVRLCTTKKNILTAIAVGPGITHRYVVAPWERSLYTDNFNKIVQDASKASMSVIRTSEIDGYFWGSYLAVLDDPMYILNDNMPYFYIFNLADK